MAQRPDLALMYETLLTVPGMNQSVKVELKLPRKVFLLLSKVIERGMQPKGEEKEGLSIMEIAPQDTMAEISGIAGDILQKAGLSEMNEKLNAFRQ